MISHGKRWRYAFRVFFSLIFHGRIAEDILADFATQAPPPVVPPPAAAGRRETDSAIQILALLQRDGRLVDFLMEDLSAYPDAQIGAAARDVHSGCRGTMQRYLTLVPVVDEDEGRPVTVEQGTDPARVKVVGNVAAPPPVRGVLRHRGWEVERIELPPLSGTGRAIVAPAEIEVA